MLVDSSTPLVDSRVEELVLWTQNLTLLGCQGLWIQTIVLHCYCAKAASNKYLLVMMLVTENISPCALQVLLELNEYQISKNS